MGYVADLVENASDAALAVDGDQRIMAWNDRASTLLGYSAPEVIGRFCHEILQAVLPGGEPLCHPGCEASLCFGRCQSYAVHTCSVRCHDGGWRRVGIASLTISAQGRGGESTSAAAILFLRPKTSFEEKDDAPRSPRVRIFTLGRFALAVGARGLAVERWDRKQSLTLLKYLALHVDQTVHRGRLIDLLWPDADEETGRERLKVVVYSLRKKIFDAGAGKNIVEFLDGAYRLRRDAVWIDHLAFDELVARGRGFEAQGRSEAAFESYEQARHLYRGDLLGEELYADWCSEERERLRETYLDLLMRLRRFYAARNDHEEAVQICRVALIHESCRESFHRALMESLCRLGRRRAAIEQFHRCRRILDEELAVEPSSETWALYETISSVRKARSVF